MNDDQLADLIRTTMREQDRHAPSEREVRGVARSLPDATPRPRSWWPALLSAAAVLAVIGASALLLPRLGNDSPSVSESPGIGPSTPPQNRTVTIFLAQRVPGLLGVPDWGLLPVHVPTRSTGDPAADALHALFMLDRPRKGENWLRPNGTDLLDVRSVSATPSLITVDLMPVGGDITRNPYAGRKCVSLACSPSPQQMLQQIAWTISTALQSQSPIAFTINGEPASRLFGEEVTVPGYPNPSEILAAHRDFTWFQRACGPITLSAVLNDGTILPINRPSDGPNPSVVLKVGQTATLEMTGVCFRFVNVELSEPGLGSVRGVSGDQATIVGLQEGTTHVTVTSTTTCNISFEHYPPCPGPLTIIADFDLLVEPV